LSDPHELARSLQFELKRVGCFNGAVNGEFDDATRTASHAFAKLTSIHMPDELSPEAIKAVREIDKRVCPLACPDGERAEGDRCIAAAPHHDANTQRTRNNASASVPTQALGDAESESFRIRPVGSIPTGTTAVLTAQNGRKMTCTGGVIGVAHSRRCHWN
jgi:hypothetical protein